jgi:hypothetical protein
MTSQNEECEQELIMLLQVRPPSNKVKAQKHKAKVMEHIAKRADWGVTLSRVSRVSNRRRRIKGRSAY